MNDIDVDPREEREREREREIERLGRDRIHENQKKRNKNTCNLFNCPAAHE
jgi:hypothetical protein